MKKKVLIFPCGSEVGLEAHRALSNSKHFEVFGATSVTDHSRMVFKNQVFLPFIDDPNFYQELDSVLRHNGIDFILPVQDTVVLKLAENASKINAVVVSPPRETCLIARSKLLTYETLKTTVRVPEVFISKKGLKYPVFLKPDIGEGSKGTFKVNNPDELEFYLERDKSLLILEYLPGKEYTIDCFTDRKGYLLYAGARERTRIANGASVNSKIIEDEKFLELARAINNKLAFRGVWFFQVKEDSNGDYVLMEIAARMPGTLALTRVHGPNLVLLSLFDRMDLDVEIVKNSHTLEIDRAYFARYSFNYEFETVYVDFDDTLILEDKVNPILVHFLYQAKNSRKNIVLLTKHDGDITSSLLRNNLSLTLFSEIIHLKRNDQKSNHINSKNSIFIDDSFNERKLVSMNTGIPVFDLDSIEALIDWRQ